MRSADHDAGAGGHAVPRRPWEGIEPDEIDFHGSGPREGIEPDEIDSRFQAGDGDALDIRLLVGGYPAYVVVDLIVGRDGSVTREPVDLIVGFDNL